MKKINVGIIGFGTVGSGLAQTLYEQRERLRQRTGAEFELTTVADIAIDSLPEQFSGVTLTRNADDIFNDPEIDIVVELIGGIEPAKVFYLKPFQRESMLSLQTKPSFPSTGRRFLTALSPRMSKLALRPVSAAASLSSNP